MAEQRSRRQQRAGTGHHLASVADAFLGPDPVRSGPQHLLVVAAPGARNTAAVLAGLASDDGQRTSRDLGSGIGERVAGWERDGLHLAHDPGSGPLLFWCVDGVEAVSTTATIALGRLAALVGVGRVIVLWFPAGTGSLRKVPERIESERAQALARAAAPDVPVVVHCVGWTATASADLGLLAAQFN